VPIAKDRPKWRLELTRTNTNPNDTGANASGRSGNARALRIQSKCGVYHEGEGHWPKFSQKLQKARHLRVARTPQKQLRGRRASVARDVRNTKVHWQRSEFAFQRAGRLLFCPRAMRGPGRAGTPSSSAEWQ